MKVYTYFEPLPDIPPDPVLFRLWRKSWVDMGWETVVLGLRDVMAVDATACREIWGSRELRRGPCPRGYNGACHVRWIAHSGEGGLHVDYDVLNRSFTPDDMRVLISEMGESRPIFLSGTTCPCAVYATPEQTREMVNCILSHGRDVDARRLDAYNCGGELRYVAHDQAIFERFAFRWGYPKPPVCVDYSAASVAWRTAQLSHFPNGTTPHPRGQHIINSILAIDK